MHPEHSATEQLAAAVRLFNAGEYFECHDVLEEVWSETLTDERTFYQGLIHAAVALHHFEEANLGGARKMYLSARRYLDPFTPVHGGLDLAAFLDRLETCFADLLSITQTSRADVRLQPELRPLLQWKADR